MKIRFIQDVELQIINEIDGDGIPTHFDYERFVAGEVIDVDIFEQNNNSISVQFGDGSISIIVVGCFEEITG